MTRDIHQQSHRKFTLSGTVIRALLYAVTILTSCALSWLSVLAIAVFAQPAVAPSAQNANLAKTGEYVTRVADCIACHTADKSKPFAGGVPFKTAFGTIYSPNITPDQKTGIGKWSDADFLRALHEGIGKDGERLYPVFPYTSYTKVTDQDALTIKAYLFSLPPIRYKPPPNMLKFPFNHRFLIVFWNLFNFKESRFKPDPQQTVEWNRGAYLVEGLGHCEECHTPRNFMQGLSRKKFAGGTIEGWEAFNITSDPLSGIGKWTNLDVGAYLANGIAPRKATAAGPMAEVVENSTRYLTETDLRAMVTYLRYIPPMNNGDLKSRNDWGAPANDVTRVRGAPYAATPDGAQLFLANCASCHHWSGQGVGGDAPGSYPPLIHNSTVGSGKPNNLTLVALHGVQRDGAKMTIDMPGFAESLSDQDVAALVNYITGRFGNPDVAATPERVAKLRSGE